MVVTSLMLQAVPPSIVWSGVPWVLGNVFPAAGVCRFFHPHIHPVRVKTGLLIISYTAHIRTLPAASHREEHTRAGTGGAECAHQEGATRGHHDLRLSLPCVDYCRQRPPGHRRSRPAASPDPP